MSATYALQQVCNALVVGSFYSLLAVSYALVHGLTNRIVLSFGDMAMFAAFCAAYGALIAFSLWLELPAVLLFAVAAAGMLGGARPLRLRRRVRAALRKVRQNQFQKSCAGVEDAAAMVRDAASAAPSMCSNAVPRRSSRFIARR